MLLKFFVVAIFQLRPNLPTLKRTIGLKRGHLSESSFRSAGAIICIENRWNARTQTYTEDSLFCWSFDEESCLGDLRSCRTQMVVSQSYKVGL